MPNTKRHPSKFFVDESQNKNQLTSRNQQIIKLYITLCEQPIPDIINQKQQSIFSHFKFYFSDDDLIIQCTDQNGDIFSVLHQPDFENHINSIYQRWKQQNNKVQGQNKTQPTANSNKQNNSQLKHLNFIAFVEFWIRSSPNLVVSYRVYNELVKQSVQKFLQNKFYSISFSLTQNQNPFKLKNQLKSNKKVIKNSQINACKLSDQVIQKRLHIYFTHFSKIQNIASSATYVSKTKTFDEIVKSYSAINLQQWITFIKCFGFDKVFEEFHKKKAHNQQKICKQKTKINEKAYLPVKNVKWNSSLQYFKNLFQKFCDNTKHIDFQSFKNILKKLFQQIYLVQQNQTDKQAENPKFISKSSQQTGILHLKLNNQQQFNNKLRSLGIFVSVCPVVIQHPSQTISKRSYHQVKPKYLNIPKLPLLSQNKIKQGRMKTSLKDNKNIVLPGLFTKSNNESKIYTLSQIMAVKTPHLKVIEQKKQTQNIKRDKTTQLAKQNINSKMEKSSNFKKTDILIKQKQINNAQYKKQQKQENNKKIRGRQQKKITFVSELQRQMQDEPDQYLINYQNKPSTFNFNTHNNPYIVKKVKAQKMGSPDKNDNIIKRLDQRAYKIQRKML